MPELSRQEMKDRLVRLFRNKEWRMANLYYIKDKDGRVVLFKPNSAQRYLYANRHRRNIIPKARQRGISTGILIDYLDDVLFNPNFKAATLAHREADALKLFASKIKFPFDNIPAPYKPYVPTILREANSVLEFSNGSIISAETMVRSDTLQRLHVSELAKLYRQQPARAEEVKTGAIPAAERGIIDIESTMEGRFGLMYEMSEKAYEMYLQEETLTEKDFKFFFFPWWGCEDYVLDTPVDIDPEHAMYFKALKDNDKIELTPQQQWWYIKEHEVQGEKMKQEYPASYKESTEVANEGMFFGPHIVRARKEGRICFVPYNNKSLVYAAMDIGRSDSTAIWTFQTIQNEIHFLDYFEHSGEDIDFYDRWMQNLPYKVRLLGLPHDSESKVLSSSKSVADIFRRDFHYEVIVLKRDEIEIQGINEARAALDSCWIDKVKCKRGLECLDKFRKDWDEKHGCYRSKSVHDEFSDGAKGFIYSIQLRNRLTGRRGDMSVKEYRKLKKRHRRVI